MRIPKIGSIRILTLLLLVTLVSGVGAAAEALPSLCENPFRTEGLTHSAPQSTAAVKLRNLVDRLHSTRYVGDQGSVVNATNSDVRAALKFAKEILESSGTKARLVGFADTASLEIVPEEKSLNGWNRMAFSLAKNYGSNLIYSPLYLASIQSRAAYDRESGAVLISFESLIEGRSEKNVLHEIGHMKSDATKESSPNIFSGSIERISDSAGDYSSFMVFDELPRLAQDLDRTAREIEKSTSALKRHELSRELSEVSLRGRTLLATTQTAIAFAKKIRSELMTQELQSGPLALETGDLAISRAYVAAGPLTQVIVDERSDRAVRIRFEDSDFSTELWIANDGTWTQTIADLQLGHPRASRAFQKQFANLVLNWENQLQPSLAALRIATEGILSADENVSMNVLTELARKPRKTLAPHLKRTSR